VFPQIEFGNDVQALKDYAQTAEGLGYDYLLVYDHVLGAHPNREPKLTGPYTYEHPFHEPMVFFGFLAAITTKLELVTGILILPQRQTALVAKQTAEVDVLSGGRLRLGIGIGWNYVEYDALGEEFRTRGRRVEEQIEVLRKLWTQPLPWLYVSASGLRELGAEMNVVAEIVDPDLQALEGKRGRITRQHRRYQFIGGAAEFEDRDAGHEIFVLLGRLSLLVGQLDPELRHD
jgi:alkanesulfonate monooxygenase SsuD/methylene tetrahydromethanopterin reductase-like flavin-dependent oxidoreductase (luciferase family)